MSSDDLIMMGDNAGIYRVVLGDETIAHIVKSQNHGWLILPVRPYPSRPEYFVGLSGYKTLKDADWAVTEIYFGED